MELTGFKDDLNIMEKGFPEIFFVVLLAPIIFTSAYTINKKIFYANIGSILVMAFLGTFISACMVTLMIYYIGYFGFCVEFSIYEAAAYGALISATDPVSVIAIFKDMGADKNLFSLIFGESIFNDAAGIVLY